MEKPTTDHLKALGYRLTHSVARGVYIVVRPDGLVVPNSYAMSPTKAWGLARDYIAREIEATTQPKAEDIAMNQTEIDELRRLHEAATPGDWEATGWEAGSHGHKHDTCCIAVKGSQTFLTGDIPETPRRRATHKFIAASHNALPRLLAALEEARAERDRARQKTQAMEEQAMADEDGMSMRPLDGRLRKVEAERDALKEKLAALVTDIEAAMHFVNHTACLPVCGLYCTPPSRCTCGVNDIRNALAAAKVQPTDLDQLTR